MLTDDVDIDRILISNKVSGQKCCKYFTGQKDDKKERSLCTMLPKMSGRENILMKLNVCFYRR